MDEISTDRVTTRRGWRSASGQLLVLIMMLALIRATAARAEEPAMAGFYGGGFGEPGAFSYTQIEIDEGPVLTGRISQPYARSDSPPMERPQRDGSRLRFEAAGLAFDLRRTATGFEGT